MSDSSRSFTIVGGDVSGGVAGRDLIKSGASDAAEARQVLKQLDLLLTTVRSGTYGGEADREVAPVLKEARDAVVAREYDKAGTRLAVAADRARRVGNLVSAIESVARPVRGLLGL
ncbi:hypothetical protein [Glycomyces sp. NRRL B-16210]|uniref:hypothetical protein n=1 Tax=Glycomyces sp. NRRL B-16210 TaxID=1463821 RepID=UPI00105C5ED1|nr:hypothetical protein [Glycomyces sp. NRRL B-16210]